MPACTAPLPFPTRLARVVSWLLHPFAMPLYVLLVLFIAPNYLQLLTAPIKGYLVWVVILYTMVIPALGIAFLRTLGILGNLSIRSRRERVWPLVLSIVCYVLCALTVGRIAPATIVARLLLAGACCQAFALAVTLYWKISLHLTAIGGVVGLLALLTWIGAGRFFGALVLFVLLAGVLASARLQLGAHTTGQVAAGFAGGFLVTAATMMLL